MDIDCSLYVFKRLASGTLVMHVFFVHYCTNFILIKGISMKHHIIIIFVMFLSACQAGIPDPNDTEGPELTVYLNEQDESSGTSNNYVVASTQGTSAIDRSRYGCEGLNASGRTYRYRDVSSPVFGALNYPADRRSAPESAAVFMRSGQMPNFTVFAEDSSGIKDIRVEVIEGVINNGADSGRNDSGMTVLAPTDVRATNDLDIHSVRETRYLKVAQRTYDDPFVWQPMQIEIPRFTSELVKFTATDFVGNKSTARVYWLPRVFCVDTRPGFP